MKYVTIHFKSYHRQNNSGKIKATDINFIPFVSFEAEKTIKFHKNPI